MASIGIDGLVSGLDTTSLINQLMQVEAMPQTLLAQKKTGAESFVSALQSLNAKVSSLADAAKTAATASSWDAFKATSSSTAVTATASSSAQPSSLSFTVDRLAQSQTSVVAVPASFQDDPPTFTIVRGGEETTITAASGSIADVVAAFNDSDSGIRAVAVRVSGGDEPVYKLQLTGTGTGAENAFEVYDGDQTSGTHWVDSSAASRSARDAQITLFPGTVDATALTSSTNTFAGLLTGVDVTVSKAEDDPVTVTIARDDDAVTKLASNLVSQLGLVLSEIAARTATTTTTDDDGRTVITGGLFSADSAVRNLQQRILAAGSAPVDGFSPSEVGIVIGRDGTFTFDEAKFAEALAADPDKVQRIVSGVAANVQGVADAASDKYDGSLTLKITNQESAIKDMGEQISAWDRRLELRRESLQRTYAALEVTLSGLQTQSSWLTSQLAALNSSSSSS